jgi:hypothetical protein
MPLAALWIRQQLQSAGFIEEAYEEVPLLELSGTSLSDGEYLAK